MASLITKNTMIDVFESNEYIRVILFNNEYRLYYNGNVELVKGKGVNDLYKYQATKMAVNIISQERQRRKNLI